MKKYFFFIHTLFLLIFFKTIALGQDQFNCFLYAPSYEDNVDLKNGFRYVRNDILNVYGGILNLCSNENREIDEKISKMLIEKGTTSIQMFERHLNEFVDRVIRDNSSEKVTLFYLTAYVFTVSPNDIRIGGNDFNRLSINTTSFSFNRFFEKIKPIKGKKIIFLDVAEGENILNLDVLKRLDNYAIIVSGRKHAYEDDSLGSSLFSHIFRKALEEDNTDKNLDGLISYIELWNYIEREMPVILKELRLPNEKPIEKHRGINVNQPLLEKAIKPIYNLVWLTPNPDENNNKNQTTKELPIKLKAFSTTSNTNLQPEDFKIYINNQRQITKSGETLLRGTTFNAVVQLQNGKNNIKVCIGNNCSKTLTAYYTAAKPNLHLLTIGTNPPDLQYTEKDANDFANIYKSQKRLFANVFIEELVGDGATRTAIIEQLEMLNYQHQEGHIRPNDVVMLFISSHGYIETQDNNRFRIQASDFNPAFYKTRSVAYEEITQTLSDINCKKIIWIDACHSGGAKANAALINRYIQQLNDTYAGITTITSSTQNQKSYEHTNWQNGAFTEAILQGLSGKADGKGTAGSRDGVITLGELYSYIGERVPQLVNSINKPTQQPQITRDDLGDLGIFVY